MKIDSKLPNVGTTIFTVMSQLAAQHKAINLGQGFPDFNPDSRLVELVTEAMSAGHNQYPQMAGVPVLREAVSDKILAVSGHQYDPATEITITSGASEALMSSILAFVHAGDEVLIVEPFYDLYIPAIQLAGGRPVIVAMEPPCEQNPSYRLDWQKVREAITDKTRLLILNFPHNPTGIILSETDLDALEDIVNETGILILSDEVYEHIVFDGKEHLSLARRPALAERSVIISSFGKTYHVTGWKVGYCAAPARITEEIRKIHQFMVFTVTSPMQWALAEYMKDRSPYMELSAFYQKKRDRLAAGLQSSRFKPLPSQGSFFLLADYSDISSASESEFATSLTVKHGVTVIPMSAFYENPNAESSNHSLVRFCFAKQDPTLEAALEKLRYV